MLGIKRITGAAGSAPAGEPGSWVSDAAREKFMAAYERTFALWPQPVEEFDVETATATTRVHAYRPHPDGAAIVLLSGAGGNAAAWFPHVAALAEDGPVYGIDMPGDANPSVPRAPLAPADACAAWLDELLGKLSDRPAHLVGFSYGGWVAMNQAIRAPGRVASITLLDPAGLTKLDARFWWWFTISGLASLTPMPLRRRMVGGDFYTVKRIDNSRLVRHVEPVKLRNLYKTMALGGFVALFCMLYVYQHFRCIDLSFQLEDLRGKQEQASALNSELKLEISGLRDPHRIDVIAQHQLGLKRPDAMQVRDYTTYDGEQVAAVRLAGTNRVP